MTALADNVARLRQVLARQNGPTIVVGLVYIAAFGLDQGESLGALLAQGPVTPALAHLFTDKQGFTWLTWIR